MTGAQMDAGAVAAKQLLTERIEHYCRRLLRALRFSVLSRGSFSSRRRGFLNVFSIIALVVWIVEGAVRRNAEKRGVLVVPCVW